MISNHLNELNTLVTKLVSVGVPLDDKIKEILLLCSLSNNWEGVFMVESTSIAAKSKMKFYEVIATLLSEEDMQRKHQDPSSDDALTNTSARNRGRNFERGEHDNNGRGRSNHHSKSSGRNCTCWFCGKLGHIKK